MKKKEAEELIRATVIEWRMSERPVTVDTVYIDFEKRTVVIRGNVYHVTTPAFAFPIISSDRIVMSQGGEVL